MTECDDVTNEAEQVGGDVFVVAAVAAAAPTPTRARDKTAVVRMEVVARDFTAEMLGHVKHYRSCAHVNSW
jgi:hypothetical protein